MFEDLVKRAQISSQNVKAITERKKEVKLLFIKVIEEAIEEIEDLGFVGIRFQVLDSIPSFKLMIRSRKGYDHYDFSFNLELSSTGNYINYGYGATSAKGNQMEFDYNWDNSKLITTMNNALRAVVLEALKSLEINKLRGWT